MSKTSRFRTPFGSQGVNGSQSLLKTARHHFYTTVLLILDRLSCKKLLLVRFQILPLFLNTMTTNDEIFRRNRDHFGQQIQMKLSQKPKTIYQVFFAFQKSTLTFENFRIKKTLLDCFIGEPASSQINIK